MTQSRKPSYQKNICPMCGGMSVTSNDKVLGFRAPKFNCPDCGAGLTTTPTPRILWAFAVVFIGLPVAFVMVRWLQSTFDLHGTLLACIYGGVGGGIGSYAFKLMHAGLVFKPWQPGGF